MCLHLTCAHVLIVVFSLLFKCKKTHILIEFFHFMLRTTACQQDACSFLSLEILWSNAWFKLSKHIAYTCLHTNWWKPEVFFLLYFLFTMLCYFESFPFYFSFHVMFGMSFCFAFILILDNDIVFCSVRNTVAQQMMHVSVFRLFAFFPASTIVN